MPHRVGTPILGLALGLALVAASAASSAGERKPSGEELSRIESVLREAGFTSWEEIEFDDGHWDVDDARTGDGRKYDLRLDPTNLQIISRDEDD